MRISDWSSDVCSSDLFCRSQAEALGPFDRRCPLAQACSHARPTLSRLSTISDKIVPQPRDGDKEVTLGRQALLPAVEYGDSFAVGQVPRSEEHTSELQSLMRISYAVFCLKNKNKDHCQ